MSNPVIVSVKTIIHYPHQAHVGRTYLMTIDLAPDEGFDWRHDEEEYPIYCAVKSDIFSSKAIGAATVVLHRFGGSYGPANFLLTASNEMGSGKIKIDLINDWGVSIQALKSSIEVDVEVIESNSITTYTKDFLVYHSLEVASPFIENLLSNTHTLNTKSNHKKAIKSTLLKDLNNQKSQSYQVSEFKLEPQPPKVFISYSHDSAEQMDLVLSLANHLREDGIDCNIDQYEPSPGNGWFKWMIDEIESSDFVLMICTSEYVQRFRGNKEDSLSMGIVWEGAIITQDLYFQRDKKSKYIPIIFASEDANLMPKVLLNTVRYNLVDSNGYELLYRHLTDQHKISKPELGVLQALKVHERKQFFDTSIKKDNIQERQYCNLPHRKEGSFIGRSYEISELLRRISPNYRQHINVVRGIGGVGKTSLVIETAHLCWQAKNSECKDHNIPIFDAIIFTSSKATDLVNTQIVNRPEKEPLLTDIFRVISDVLNEPTITQVGAEEQSKKVNEILAKKSTLLIVDNMETLLEEEQSIILSFLNNVPVSTQVIITTRGFLGFDGIVIESLTRSESFDLLDSQAKIKNLTVNNAWKKHVYRRFGGIPIALIYAIGKRAAGYRFMDIIDPKRMLTKDLGQFCFESSVALIREDKAYQLLIATTFFPATFCRDALIKVAKLIDGHQNVTDAFAKLQQLSLITEEKKGRYSILSITREYAILELEKDENNEFKKGARDRWLNWYLDFTKLYGGQDWEGWRAKYDRLEEEWENIQSVLNWYAEKSKWDKVLQLWENIDNYADLSGYWQDRRYWWALLGKNHGSVTTRVRALSEKGFTLILMGNYQDAEQYLRTAWDIHKEVDKVIQSTIANHLSILSKCKKDYIQSHKWLDIEADLLLECPSDTKRKPRYQIRNLYYRAETNYLEGKKDIAKTEFSQVIYLCKKIGWQRFKNYAKNILAEIYIEQGDLCEAEAMLKAGLLSAIRSREKRRVALYHASYAHLYYWQAQKVKKGELEEKSKPYIEEAKESALKAMEVFSKEFMLDESNKINKLIEQINEY